MDSRLQENNTLIEKNEFNDIQGNTLYPDLYNNLLTELQTNKLFRNCIDKKLGIHNDERYNEFMEAVKSKDFKINKHLEFIEYTCNKFTSLHPDEIKDCINKLNYSPSKIDVLTKKICKGDISFTMIETITLIFQFIGIHIEFQNLDQNSIQILIKLTKQILNKVIRTADHFEGLMCKNGEISQITKNLKTIYNELFNNKSKSIKYPFKNPFKLEWFEAFNKNIFGKMILLIFICFIFAKIVDLFSGKDCPQVPVNK